MINISWFSSCEFAWYFKLCFIANFVFTACVQFETTVISIFRKFDSLSFHSTNSHKYLAFTCNSVWISKAKCFISYMDTFLFHRKVSLYFYSIKNGTRSMSSTINWILHFAFRFSGEVYTLPQKYIKRITQFIKNVITTQT